MKPQRDNNFDLLRVLAAFQVAIFHAVEHLEIDSGVITEALGIFPGVPIFFVISGYLVSQSLARSDLRSYFTNRALRIFPGLWMCLAVSIAIALMAGVTFPPSEALPWLVAQMSILQFYNPDFLREFGVGVLNGSLWTIPVELQFYLALPLLALFRTRALLLIACAFVVVNQAFVAFASGMPEKLAAVSLAPWLYMFLIGVLFQRRPDMLRLLVGKLPLLLALYIACAVGLGAIGLPVIGNHINPISATMLALVVLSAAHARKISTPSDISYGLYLYHMPIINLMIEHDLTGSVSYAAIAVCASVLLAVISWRLVEKPALQCKHRLHTRQPSSP